MSIPGLPLLVVAAGAAISAAAATPRAPRSAAADGALRESDAVLVNPGMGFVAFQRCDGQHAVEVPRASICYLRLYWSDLEPEEGAIRFAELDARFHQAEAHGQRIALRIMAAGASDHGPGVKVPAWLMRRGIRGWWYGAERASFMPDFADPVFLEHARALIVALGARYGADPRLDHVDVGWLGHYGEWQLFQAGKAGAVLPGIAVQRQYVEWMREAFPDTPVLLAIDAAEALPGAVRAGCGWRADGWGDSRVPWNHMAHHYPAAIRAAGIRDAWRHAPVALETWGTMQDWFDAGWDVDAILDYALAQHVSIVNAKSSPIPAAWHDKIDAFQKRMGYRLVVRQSSHPAHAVAGGPFTVGVVFENVGVAPPYRSYDVAFRLRDRAGQVGSVFRAGADLRTWLPGRHGVEATGTLARDARPGDYSLETAVIERKTGEPAVQLAVDAPETAGWYEIGTVGVAR